MKYAVIKKEDLNKWLQHLKRKARLYAPKKKENQFIFRPVKDVNEITLKYIPTILPPKKYYYPQKEKLFRFHVRPFKTSKAIKAFEEYILFAVHTCDIAGIQCMDVVFREGPEDPNYLNRKDKMTIIGMECLEYCDKYASCASMGNHEPRGGYDLMMVDLGEKFILHINSEKGERLIHGLAYIKEANEQDMLSLERVREAKKKVFKEEFNASLIKVYEVFDKHFNSRVWQDVGKRCVACGNCTTVCPTCYCFDTLDEMELSLNEGMRYRIWNSCQMEDFAKVAVAEDLGLEAPSYNPYLNTVAQMVEWVHCLEESIKIMEKISKEGLDEKKIVVSSWPKRSEVEKIKYKPNIGIGCVEVPRGSLFHEYSIDETGNIAKANYVISTNQNMENLEEDMRKIVPELLGKKTQEAITLDLEMLARAYDPCISCATHILDVKFV